MRLVLDGGVSLYFNSGGGRLGLGEQSERIRSAGVSLLISVGQTLPHLSLANTFDPPIDQKARLFLLTRSGTYSVDFDMSVIETYSRPIQFLNMLVQHVLTAIRVNSTAG